MQQPVTVDIQVYRKSVGHDYFVRIMCGDRETTPFRFTERYQAEYEKDHFAWVFGLRPDKPELMSYNEKTHPNDT